jgi:hypothetical protein
MGAEALESGETEADPVARVWSASSDWTTMDEGGLTNDMWHSPHLKRMKMAPTEVRSDGALEAVATWWFPLAESCRSWEDVRKQGVLRS